MFFRSLLVVVGAVALIGCGGGDYCSRNSPCPNDTPPTQAERDSCRATLQANANAPCYGEALASANCAADNLVCSGTGQTDPVLSATKAQNNCTNQVANYVSCCTKNPNSTVC